MYGIHKHNHKQKCWQNRQGQQASDLMHVRLVAGLKLRPSELYDMVTLEEKESETLSLLDQAQVDATLNDHRGNSPQRRYEPHGMHISVVHAALHCIMRQASRKSRYRARHQIDAALRENGEHFEELHSRKPC
eukprot:5834839-Amphidinium_carterae.2